MKVFISWSGEQSRAAASVLLDWLPMVIQSVEPYMSEETDKGVRWSAAVGKELEQTDFGVICLTPENLEAPWIHFEAGALAKSMDNARLAPLLLGLKKSEVQGPLSQFQLTDFTQEDVRRLVGSMNSFKPDESLDGSRLDRIFQALWKQLHDGVTEALASVKTKPRVPRVSNDLILEELLTLSRSQAKAIPDLLAGMTDKLQALLAEQFARTRFDGAYDPRFIEEIQVRWHRLYSLTKVAEANTSAEQVSNELWQELLARISSLRGPLEFLFRPYGRPAKGAFFKVRAGDFTIEDDGERVVVTPNDSSSRDILA